jgi:hypothetical protein
VLQVSWHDGSLFAGTDSLKTLIEDCQWTKEMVSRCLQINSAMYTNALQRLRDIEHGRDATYWFSLRVRGALTLLQFKLLCSRTSSAKVDVQCWFCTVAPSLLSDVQAGRVHSGARGTSSLEWPTCVHQGRKRAISTG